MNQKNRSMAVIIAVMVIALALAPLQAMAQQVTGKLGSPSATTTISGKQLPPPAPWACRC